MNLNLVDLSNTIKTEYKGLFCDIVRNTTNSSGGTNICDEMLDRKSKNMNNVEFLDNLKSILDSKDTNIIGEIARDTGVTVDKVQAIMSGLVNLPIQFNKKGEYGMRESFQIGDKIEINNSGEGTHNYAGMLDNQGIVKELKTRISDLQKLLKEKDELIAAEREMNELLKKQLKQD